ncbi:phospholipase D-like domain-containing protein [Pontiella sulfatireligans]|uniref:Restriction endonuclease type II NgoFVII C-terminal B3-like DNA-binding domain-containing protein n=1 Tax=Pontiella sulfatireligans TaxID=2750658 RepID=A0A6C2UQ81_9BACT|nr:NgoFVII family restriction endonuclease [Pontiella sulfatireligans]VGO21464.1 hypothetical protein SCARR_03538 [Pontiella sulfatireligans]
MLSIQGKQLTEYADLLAKVGSLSNLFSDSDTPMLHYRAAENIFCRSTGAENMGRADCAFDAKIGSKGFGLKTFLCHGQSSTEKVAEFNALSGTLAGLNPESLAVRLGELRNTRIGFAEETYGIDHAVYHCVGRRPGRFLIFEVPYQCIHIDSIRDVRETRGGIAFRDRFNEYSFNRSKSTLFKKFTISSGCVGVDVAIAEDPFALLQSSALAEPVCRRPFVILPLYAVKAGEKYVPEKSGLNQWNASGRPRDAGEVYIPIPRAVHTHQTGFFPERDAPFTLVLPDGRELSAKVCQQGSKALMTNPNKALSDWLLRSLFKIPERELITYDVFRAYGTDSVRVERSDDDRYRIEFAPLNAYERFISAS